MIWPRRPLLFIPGLVLVSFGLGLAIGSRLLQKPAISPQVTPATFSQHPDFAPLADTQSSCVEFRSASTLVGKAGCVAGLVQRVYTAHSGNTFLDFCQDFRDCPFTSLVFATDKPNFGDLGTLQGKRVELHGEVTSYQGRPEIIVHDPGQVRSAP
jgi:hypothetical protein